VSTGIFKGSIETLGFGLVGFFETMLMLVLCLHHLVLKVRQLPILYLAFHASLPVLHIFKDTDIADTLSALVEESSRIM
jgi:hypothetical protein